MLYLSGRQDLAVGGQGPMRRVLDTTLGASRDAEEFFIWIRHNPLKSPESAKGIQGNPSFFAWFYLVLLGFIWRKLAPWLYLSCAGTGLGRGDGPLKTVGGLAAPAVQPAS
jgi:hypothetical protein